MTLTMRPPPPNRTPLSAARPVEMSPVETESAPTNAGDVLIVEDEADIAGLIAYNLGRQGYRCDCVSSGDAALAHIERRLPDLIILDRMLPGLSGDEVARRLKRDPRTASIPLLVVTAKTQEADQLEGFSAGADDYVTKPFSIKVLLARVAALLRRRPEPPEAEETIAAGPISLFPSRHEAAVDGVAVVLTAAEFRLLKALIKARGRVLSRSQLLDDVSGAMAAVTDRTIDVHVTALRRKLGPASGWLQTVRGVGYTLRPPAASGQ